MNPDRSVCVEGGRKPFYDVLMATGRKCCDCTQEEDAWGCLRMPQEDSWGAFPFLSPKMAHFGPKKWSKMVLPKNDPNPLGT